MVMHRRHFLSRGAVASLGGSGALGFLGELPRVAAAEAQVLPKGVRLGDGVEPLVRLLEETPRERLMEEGAQRMRGFVLGQGGLLRSPSMRRGRFDRCDGRGQTVGL